MLILLKCKITIERSMDIAQFRLIKFNFLVKNYCNQETLLKKDSILFHNCNVCDSYSLERLRVRQLFKGGNYLREETINHQEVLAAETIQGRKVFKGGNYMRKYGKYKKWARLLQFMPNQSLDIVMLKTPLDHGGTLFRTIFFMD